MIEKIVVSAERAEEIVNMAREKLIFHLEAQRTHRHMADDCGDYLMAAMDSFAFMLDKAVDGISDQEIVNEWLNQPADQWLAVDGDIRWELPECKEMGGSLRWGSEYPMGNQ